MADETGGSYKGREVVGSDGEGIGKATDVFLDDATGRPAWVAIHTGRLRSKTVYAPLEGAALDGDDLVVAFGRDVVRGAPTTDGDDGYLSPEQEADLRRHYAAAAEEATTLTRSEEQVQVDTERVEADRVRLRKHVETEQVTRTVPVSHDEVRIEREPITDDNRDEVMAQIGDDEREVVLYEERPVVTKETVPVERVRIVTESVEEQVEVHAEVRKERIEPE